MAITLKLSSVDVKSIAAVLEAVAKMDKTTAGPTALAHAKAHFGEGNLARIAAAMETALAADADKGRRRRA